MKRKLTLGLTVALALSAGSVSAQSARLQVIHNCADQAAAQVDIWLNNFLLLDDFAFRMSTPFIDAPAGVTFTVSVCAPNSTDPSNPLYSVDLTLNDGSTYIAIASGIVSPSGYSPAQPFSIEVFDQGRELANGGNGTTDVLVFHGSTDAPTVDVVETSVPAGTVVDNASYTDFAGYLELPTGDYTLAVRDASGTTTLAAYNAPLLSYGLDGLALTVLASGFLDPSANSNGPAFGLWVALPGGGALVPLPSPSPSARLQVIHNCADFAAYQVDVWVNNFLLLDDFTFRTATPFIDVPANVDLTLSICASTSTDPNSPFVQQLVNFNNFGSYVVVANGIASSSGYSPLVPLSLDVYDQAHETAAAGNTDVLVFHGSTDAPTVDVAETMVFGATIVDDLSYTEFSGYLSVPTDDYVLQVQDANGNPLISYQAPLSSLGLDGTAITVVASGFLNQAVNSGGPAFGLWVALPSGGNLIELPFYTAVTENSLVADASVWPNPANDQLYVAIDSKRIAQADLRLTDMTGRVVRTLPTTTLANGANRLMVDLNGVAEGMYQLSIAGEGAIRTLPVQVVR